MIITMFERKSTSNAQILQYKEPVYFREMVYTGQEKYKINLKQAVIPETKKMVKRKKRKAEN